MQLYDCQVYLRGSRYNCVPKFGVTAAEIVLLRMIHGVGDMSPDEVVADIKKAGVAAKRTDREERERLQGLYGPTFAKRDPRTGPTTLDQIFGVGAPLPKKIDGAEAAEPEIDPDELPVVPRRTRVPRPEAASAEAADLAAMA